jgi:tetratricopeptide (TPR) repeat protein
MFILIALLAIIVILILLIKTSSGEYRRKISFRDRIQLDHIFDNDIPLKGEEQKEIDSSSEQIDSDQTSLGDEEFSQSSDDSFNQYYKKGLVFFKDENYRDSIMCFNKTIEINPTEPEPYYYRGLAKSKMNLHNDAIEDFTDAMLRKLNNVDAFYERGTARLNIGDKENALRDFSSFVLINKTNAEVYYLKGALEAEQENYQRAVDDFSNAIIVNPNHESAYFKRGLAKQKLGDNAGCCEDSKTAFDKGNLEALHYLKKFCP